MKKVNFKYIYVKGHARSLLITRIAHMKNESLTSNGSKVMGKAKVLRNDAKREEI